MISITAPTKEMEETFVHALFDGMIYDIPISLKEEIVNDSLSSYEHHERFCQKRKGHMASVDSHFKLDILAKLIKEHTIKSGEQTLSYLIGNIHLHKIS